MLTLDKLDETNRESVTATGDSRLIELLIVVAIILIIAAIAIPNLLRSRMAANEAAAATNVRTLTTASLIYNTTYSNGYPPTPRELWAADCLPTCDQASLIDPIIAGAPNQKSGFTYQYAGQGASCESRRQAAARLVSPVTWHGGPDQPGRHRHRSFCSDTPGVIHYDPTGAAPGTAAACDALSPLQ